MSDDSIIQAKVEQFGAQGGMFTSVDIGNSIKEDQHWVKNSIVAAWLRQNALVVLQGYATTLIDVQTSNGPATAFLYHPMGSDPNDYKRRNQSAMPPQNTVNFPGTTPSTNSQKTKVRSDCNARLRIPASIVRQLGWNPGDMVDNSKIIINGTTPLTDGNIVHSDGRITFRRSCLGFGDGPVMAYVENGCLHFEKP
ncbi:MAG: AbrB/MazE/SpoVT family DNA-binding domain-containing protein [Candidatus Nanoarchaeia archaeon]|jgi:hypothetical protein|nr:AbrB/MazE/SpoVT family DNA-binding domain-containing protein [Candidatus Nanoarchaeia archaeon]